MSGDYNTHAVIRRVWYHFISTFHPAAVGVTCSTSLALTSRDRRGYTLFQYLDAHNEIAHDWHVHVADRAEHGAHMQALAEIIARVNHEQRQRQIDTMHTFALATHPRVGHDSAVYRVLRSSPLYDAHVMQHIWRYVYIAEMLPTCQADVEAIECAHNRCQNAS